MKHVLVVCLLAVAVVAGTNIGPATADCLHHDPKITPGKLCTPDDPNFDGFVYPSHVAHCTRAVSEAMKKAVADAYRVPQSRWSQVEFDHLIPLCAGGTNSVLNLWPEPLPHAHEKDKVENQICIGLRDGRINQRQALKILSGWLSENPEMIQNNVGLENPAQF